MSEADAPAAEPAGDEEGQPAAEVQPAPNRQRRLLILAAAVLLLLGGGGAAAWFLLAAPPADKVAEAPPETFVDVPPMQILLRSSDGTSRMLKLHVMLVPGSLGPEELTARLPLVIDRFQPFLRELRPDDLSGSAATFRVKEELLIRSNQALGQGSVRDVLIQDLIQS